MKLWKEMRARKAARKKRAGRFMAGCLALALLAGTGLWGLNVAESFANDDPEERTETQEAIEKEYPNLLASPSEDGTLSKEETAYVVMDADANVKAVSVSEWLKNGTGAKSIGDVSTLKDIENTANDKTFTQDGSKLTWDADGSDIKYRGTTDDELPVKVKVSYYLDGKKMSASEIAGKSGHVEIRFSYSISDKVESDGYTFIAPYTMASGVLLDGEHFTDIEVEGGKVIDDGSKCVCLGLAFPGLQSNLNTDLTSLDIPEIVSIKAYTDKFEIDGSYTVALRGLLAGLDLSDADSITDKVSELQSALDQLGSASAKLVSGARELSNGAATLDENAGALRDGAQSIADGSSQLSDGADALESGAAALKAGSDKAVSGSKALSDGSGALKSGSSDLANGTGQLKSGASDLSDGTGQLKSGASDLSAGTGQLKSGASDLSAGTGQLKEKSSELAAGAAGLKSGIDTLASQTQQLGEKILTMAQGSQSLYNGLDALNTNGEQLDQAGSALVTALDGMILAETDGTKKAMLQGFRDSLQGYVGSVDQYTDGVTDAYNGANALNSGVQQLAGQLPALTDGINELQSGADKLSTGSEALAAGAESADNGAKALAQGAATADDGAKALAKGASDADDGAKALAKGASDVNDGAVQVRDGASALDDGAKQLASGTKEISDGAGQLKDGASAAAQGAASLSAGADSLASGAREFKAGTSKLAAGACTLYDGMYQFNRDGIEKLISTMSEADIDGLIDRLKALADAAQTSSFIGGKSDDMNGESRIIFKTEAVKAE